ncbi:unnamed protein product [Coregonus sp. 'balchen']|nr:unnamed protein product [Coregonus sp. 'balchen']
MPLVPTPPLSGSSSTLDLQRLPPRPVRAELEGVSTSPKPHGVFPRPPPSHRPHGATKELPRPLPPPSDTDRQGKGRITGELLQNMMHKGVPTAPTKPVPPSLPSQRSLTEVTPLRRTLPSEGPRPIKPRRPPHVAVVSLFQGSLVYLAPQDSQASPAAYHGSVPLYGYIINTCVDVDYEEVKRKLKLSRAPDPSLPPPPPPPPVSFEDNDIYYDVDSSDNMNSSMTQEEDDYDDVQGIPNDFPPPPPEMSLDPKMRKKLEKDEQEFRKRFKFEGPIKVLHSMMVDASVKKAGGKDLTVVQGEILEVIQLTSDKKALCRNEQGKWKGRMFTTMLIILTEEDSALRLMSVLNNVADQLYYPCEHIAWAADAEIISAKSDKWSMRVIMLLRKKLRKSRQGDSSEGTVASRCQLRRQVRGEVLSILSSMADLSNAIHWMPPGFLWAGRFPNWLVGLMGTTSSLIGLIQMGASQAVSA